MKRGKKFSQNGVSVPAAGPGAGEPQVASPKTPAPHTGLRL